MNLIIAGFGFIAIAMTATLVRAVALSGQTKGAFAYKTMAMNTAGSFVLGAISQLDISNSYLLSVAALGCLTTFSTFISEIFAQLENRRTLVAATYLLSTLSAGVAAASLGIWLTSTLLP